MAERVQMTRKRPWRVDHPDAVIVDRRTYWGNPFTIPDCIETGFADTDDQARSLCVEAFRSVLFHGRSTPSRPTPTSRTQTPTSSRWTTGVTSTTRGVQSGFTTPAPSTWTAAPACTSVLSVTPRRADDRPS